MLKDQSGLVSGVPEGRLPSTKPTGSSPSHTSGAVASALLAVQPNYTDPVAYYNIEIFTVDPEFTELSLSLPHSSSCTKGSICILMDYAVCRQENPAVSERATVSMYQDDVNRTEKTVCFAGPSYRMSDG